MHLVYNKTWLILTKKKDAIRHDQHTDRKNITTLFFLKNSRVLLYHFFSQKQSCFIVSFLGSKMSVKRDFRSLQNFWVLGIGYWVLGIGYWVLVRWVLRWFLIGVKSYSVKQQNKSTKIFKNSKFYLFKSCSEMNKNNF